MKQCELSPNSGGAGSIDEKDSPVRFLSAIPAGTVERRQCGFVLSTECIECDVGSQGSEDLPHGILPVDHKVRVPVGESGLPTLLP